MSFEIPELPLTADAISDHEELHDESGGCRTYAFIGSGQGGGRLAESFYKLGYKKTIVCNTAPQDMKSLTLLPEDQKILLDAGAAGAGKDMRVGEEAMLKGQHRLYESMLRKFGKCDHILICVGAGGGSGGGSSLVLLETATKYMKYIGHDDAERRVGFIVTLPTNGECASPGVGTNSKYLIEELAKYAAGGQLSPLVVVDNDKIKRLFPDLTVKEFWGKVNDTVAGLFHIFNILPTKETNYTVFDAADYASLMQAGGFMIMGSTTVKECKPADAIANAIRTNLERTLLASGFNLRSATHASAVVVGGSTIFDSVPGLMMSIEGGFDALAVLTEHALVHRGVYEDAKDRLTVYTLVGGLKAPTERIAQLTRFQGVQGDDRLGSKMPAPSFGNRLYQE